MLKTLSMTSYSDIIDFFQKKEYRLILAADAEPFTHKQIHKEITTEIAAGGVATAFGPIAKASHALFVVRGKTQDDKIVLDKKGKVQDDTKSYTLKRLFFSEEEVNDYYYGFANQTLWPLCHVAFERPLFSSKWYKGFGVVNEKFAKAIREEVKGPTFIWLNDYQLSLVPKYLGPLKDVTLAFFWHIPWPTWEIFRILPQKKELLESLLYCNFIAFHRGYQARNFLTCVERELEARIDIETNRIYYKNHVTTVAHLPMGIDTDNVKAAVESEESTGVLQSFVHHFFPVKKHGAFLDELFTKQKVLLGVDRLDYTKGLLLRLEAIETFFTIYPQYKGKITYLSILAPSREKIPAYLTLKREILEMVHQINKKHESPGWQPIHLVFGTFPREKIINFYRRAAICLVTPLDDGMNLVSKEFVVAASLAKKPGMLVLSQFAGSAIDLTQAIIINPYDRIPMAHAIKEALDMPEKEKKERIRVMAETLEERNIYAWTLDFLRSAQETTRDNKKLKA